VMTQDNERLEAIWGHRLLDEGFLGIPNIIVRNYRRLGIEHGEFGLICTILTYKHNTHDPYPSHEKLAEHLQCSTRQVRKWIDSLEAKQLLLIGRRRNKDSKQLGPMVYNFKPLIDAALNLVGVTPFSNPEDDWDIEYQKPLEPEVPLGKDKPVEPEVPLEPQVRGPLEPEVRNLGPEVPLNRSLNRSEDDDEDNIRARENKFRDVERFRPEDIPVHDDRHPIPEAPGTGIVVQASSSPDTVGRAPNDAIPGAWDKDEDPYLAVEYRMMQHLGRPYIAKENDYRAIKQLLANGVPLDFILDGIDYTLTTFADKNIRSFSYCAEVIKQRWACELAKREAAVAMDWSAYRTSNDRRSTGTKIGQATQTQGVARDERYRAFYELFPDV
jgi:hypothetical protein